MLKMRIVAKGSKVREVLDVLVCEFTHGLSLILATAFLHYRTYSIKTLRIITIIVFSKISWGELQLQII